MPQHPRTHAPGNPRTCLVTGASSGIGEAFADVWKTLGIKPIGEQTMQGKLWGKVVCQMGNPYPRFGDMPGDVPPVGAIWKGDDAVSDDRGAPGSR